MKGKAKFGLQQKMLDTIDETFAKKLNKRNLMIDEINDSHSTNKRKIIALDLLLSELIKKRARLTLGGYNYIKRSMWEWSPHFPVDKRLLPKTIK